MAHFIKHALLLVGVVVFSAGNVAAQNERGFDTNYVMGDSFLFAGVRPAQLIAHLPDDSPIVQRGFPPLDMVGHKLSEIDSYSVQAAASDDPAVFTDKVLIVMQTNTPIHIQRFAESVGAEKEAFDYKDRPRYKGAWEGMPDIYFPSDQTMLMAMSERLEAAADSPMSMSPIVSQLRGVSPTAELVVIADFSLGTPESFVAMLREGMLPITGEAAEHLKSTKSIMATIDLGQDQPISIVAVTESAESANQLKQLVEQWLPSGKELVKQARQIGIPREDAKNSFERLMESLALAIDHTKVETVGNEVRVVVEREGGLKNLAEAMNLMVMNEVQVEPQPVEGVEIK